MTKENEFMCLVAKKLNVNPNQVVDAITESREKIIKGKEPGKCFICGIKMNSEQAMKDLRYTENYRYSKGWFVFYPDSIPRYIANYKRRKLCSKCEITARYETGSTKETKQFFQSLKISDSITN